MRYLKTLLMGIGSVALTVGILTLVVPKAVHAAVATLVQVVNTAANPVPTSDVHASAAQNIELFCSGTLGVSPCDLNPTTGAALTAWTVPGGMSYVITDIEITTAGGGGTTFFSLQWLVVGLKTETWYVPNNGLTTEFQFPNGIVILPGAILFSVPGGNINFVAVRGYLTPN
jgi:hypothetical protein